MLNYYQTTVSRLAALRELEKACENYIKQPISELAEEQYQALFLLCFPNRGDSIKDYTKSVKSDHNMPEYCDPLAIHLIGGREVWAPKGFIKLLKDYKQIFGRSEELKINTILTPYCDIEKEITKSATKAVVFDGAPLYLARASVLVNIAFITAGMLPEPCSN
jgi:hypothetical protein